MNEDAIVMKAKGITKDFPGVRALENVSFSLKKGEIHCLVGENGAGKSTLVKIVSGIFPPTNGEIWINGEKATSEYKPHEAIKRGISVVPQHLFISSSLSIAENIFIGHEPKINGTINWRKLFRDAEHVLDFLEVSLDVRLPVGKVSFDLQQQVCVARALALNSSILILDEPSTKLSLDEVKVLFEVLVKLKRERELAIIYISHRLAEIFEIGDRVTVLRDGKVAGVGDVKGFTQDKLIGLMCGRKLKEAKSEERRRSVSDEVILSVENVERKGVLQNISFHLRKGEILGFAGLVGARRSELALSIIGAFPKDRGRILISGRDEKINSPVEAFRLGIGMLPEDRHKFGLLVLRSMNENICLSSLKDLFRFFLKFRDMRKVSNHFVRVLSIKPPSVDTVCSSLSGGNQQKVVFARLLAKKVRILILDEPTTGIDVATKAQIYSLIRNLSDQGISIIMISSELGELVSLCDRILVMAEGRITKELVRGRDRITEDQLLRFAMP